VVVSRHSNICTERHAIMRVPQGFNKLYLNCVPCGEGVPVVMLLVPNDRFWQYLDEAYCFINGSVFADAGVRFTYRSIGYRL
jgi:hypothetical protein